jgi:DNA topoisomerase-1
MKHILTYKLFENKVLSEKELENRWNKKRDAIFQLQSNIISLRRKINLDMDSDNEKTMIIATIIRIIDKTGERVGNDISMENGHYGVSNLHNDHISVDGDRITLTYKGKSGVDHEISFTDDKVARNLKFLLKQNKGEVFVTSNSLSIKSTQVNRYLEQFNITSKDLRGFRVNKLMSEALRKVKKPETNSEIKKIFNEQLRKVAEKIGHTPGICRKNYLLPEIEEDFYNGREVQKI